MIRTAEQLKIKGLCEINDHTTNESDTEITNYPPHKKSRTSKRFESNSRNETLGDSKRENTASTSHANATAKHGSPIVLLDNNNSRCTTQKESSKSNNNSNTNNKDSDNASSSNSDNKNMASLDMGMVGIVSRPQPSTSSQLTN